MSLAELGEQMMVGDVVYTWTGYPSGWQANSAPFSGPGGGTGGFIKTGDVYIPVPITPVDTTVGAPYVQQQNSVVSGGGTYGTVAPGVVSNPIFEGPAAGSSTIVTTDNALSALKAFAESVYGSDEMGVIRQSSEVLENEPTGIRPGTMERIVLPAWARRQRGSPL